MDNRELVDAIYQRHVQSLEATFGDVVAMPVIRLTLRLALGELAERMQQKRVARHALYESTKPAQAAKSAAQVAEKPAEHPADALVDAPAEPLKKRGGGPPKKGVRTRYTSAQKARELAAAIEEHKANGAELVPDGVDEMPLMGKLRKEETFVRQQNGRPVQVTHQYIELR